MEFLAAGRVRAMIDAYGYRTTYGYDPAGRRTSTTNAHGSTTTMTYDAVGNLTAMTDPRGFRTTMAYDGANRQISSLNPLGDVTTLGYDAAGRLKSTMNPLGFVTTMSYDAAGRRTAVLDAENNRNTTVYDAAGRATETINALGHITTSVYDNAGRLKELIDARGYRTTFTRDAVGSVTVETDPLGRRTTTTYDVLNRPRIVLDARGSLATISYDEVGRLQGQVYSDGTQFTFTYDAVGNRETMVDASGTTTNAYDRLNRVDSATNGDGKTITYTYDSVGNRDTMVNADGGHFTYTYDANNRTSTIVNPANEPTTFVHDPLGRMQSQTPYNNVRTSHTYNGADWITKIEHYRQVSTLLDSLTYSYDKVGNRTSVIESAGPRVTWTYDKTYRLTREQRSGTTSYDITHTYDPVGNRTVQESGGLRTTYSYDAANQLETSLDSSNQTTTYSYDNAGNLTQAQAPAGITTNTWNDDNRLTKVILPSSAITTMLYNAEGLRLKTEDSGGIIKSIWDFRNVLQQTDGAGATQALYTLEPKLFGNLISQRRSSVSNWYLFDALGSTKSLTGTSPSAPVIASYLYKAYGEIASSVGTTVNPFKWVGQRGYQYDASLSKYYVRARHYSSLGARWTSRDPISFAGRDGNLYRYVGGNPVNVVDPSGLIAPVFLGCVGGLAGSLLTTGIDYLRGNASGCEAIVAAACDTASGCLLGALGVPPGLGFGTCLGAGAIIGVLNAACKAGLSAYYCSSCPVDVHCAIADGLIGALGGAVSCKIGGDDLGDVLFALLGLNSTLANNIYCKNKPNLL